MSIRLGFHDGQLPKIEDLHQERGVLILVFASLESRCEIPRVLLLRLPGRSKQRLQLEILMVEVWFNSAAPTAE